MLETPKLDKILYVTDLGKHTRPVFLHALAQAENNNASLLVLHVVEPMSEAACAVIQTYLSEEDVEQVRKDGMKKVLTYMKKRIDKFLKDECGGKSLESEPIAEILVVAGKPSEEILRVAEEQNVDMIVIGKSSRKVRGTKVMGSTTRRVNRLSKIPVLVVPNR
jgi:nucleotide-binding universal stress UspA family protein